MTVNINPPELDNDPIYRTSRDVLAFSQESGWFVAHLLQIGDDEPQWKVKGRDGYNLDDVLCWVELMTPEETYREYQRVKNVS